MYCRAHGQYEGDNCPACVANPVTHPADPIQDLRYVLHKQAERNPLPARFDVVSGHQAQVIISDTQTGRTTNTPLCSYRDVRRVLNDLFGEEI